MEVSVVICAYNPDVATLSRVIEGLKSQSFPRSGWEFVVVDNGSDRTVASWLDLSWHTRSRVVVEPEKGVAKARVRGIRESQGDLIVFVDDDTVPDANYLEAAVRLLREHPFIGVLGGYGRAEFQGVVEPWMNEFLEMYLEFRQIPERQAELQYARTYVLGPWVPPTAGVAVRRQVATHFADRLTKDSFLRGLGRKGKGEVLIGSEDEDLALCAVDLGMATGMTSLMKFTHIIPAWRLSKQYLLRLLYAGNYGTARLLVHRGLKKPARQEPPGLVARLRDIAGAMVRRTPADQCWRAFSQGYRDGLSGRPFDPRYS